MAKDKQYRSEIRDGMRIEWDVPIEMDDGNVLRADVFRPKGKGRYPVIMSHGPYAKGLSFQEGYETAWNIMIDNFPQQIRQLGGGRPGEMGARWLCCDPGGFTWIGALTGRRRCAFAA